MTRTERIEAWVKQQFHPKYVSVVTDELICAASEGARIKFHENALRVIFPEDYR